MQRVEPLLQLHHVLLVHQRFDQVVARPFLPMDELLHELLLLEQLDDLVERVLHALLDLGLLDFRHRDFGHGNLGRGS